MYEKFEKLLKERNVRPADVSKETGISTSTLSEWKSGKYVPKLDKILTLAKYFEVAVEYFIEAGGT